jgi:hypothetical protein
VVAGKKTVKEAVEAIHTWLMVKCKKQPFVGRIGLFFAQLTQGGFARIPTLIRHNCSTGWFFVIETGLNSGFLLHVRAVEH